MKHLSTPYRLSLGGILALGAFFVFALPWFFPPTKRVISDSYDLGFNNSIAVLGVGFTLLLLSGWFFLTHKYAPEGQESDENLLPAPPWPAISRRTRLAVGAACLLALAWGWGLWRFVPQHNYGEMKSFIPCTELILLGQKPYSQFQFNYGPAYLYLPAAAVRLTGGAIGADAGYIFSLLFFTCCGLLLLAYAVSVLRPGIRLTCFALLSLPFIFATGLGLNYTPMRFITPYAALLWIHRQTSRSFEEEKNGGLWKLIVSLAVCVIGCFCISPETGIAFLLAILVYFGSSLRNAAQAKRLRIILCGVTGLVAGVAFILFFSIDYFLSILSFGGGGFNLPIVPSLYILLYLATVASVVPRLVNWGLVHRDGGGSLALAWGALVTIFIAPALGRCDPGHVFCNGLGAFIAGAGLCTQWKVPWRRLAVAGFALVIPIWVQISSFIFMKDWLAGSLKLRGEGFAKCDRRFWLKTPPTSSQEREAFYAKELGQYPKIGTPLGCSERVEIYLKRTGKFIPEFYTAPAYGAFTAEQVEQKNAEIARMPLILVPISAASVMLAKEPSEQYVKEYSDFLRLLLTFPVHYYWRQEPLAPDARWAAYVRENFTVLRQWGPNFIMVRKDMQTPPAH